MAKFLTLSIDISTDLFLAGGASWADVRRMSRMNAAQIAAERRRYMRFAAEGTKAGR